jgi:hypothetical protein
LRDTKNQNKNGPAIYSSRAILVGLVSIDIYLLNSLAADVGRKRSGVCLGQVADSRAERFTVNTVNRRHTTTATRVSAPSATHMVGKRCRVCLCKIADCCAKRLAVNAMGCGHTARGCGCGLYSKCSKYNNDQGNERESFHGSLLMSVIFDLFDWNLGQHFQEGP